MEACVPEDQAEAAYQMTTGVRERLPDVPVIIADNVAEYVAGLDSSGRLTFSDLPPAPMPFPRCFVEWEQPPIGRSAFDGSVGKSPFLQQGCYLEALNALDFSCFTNLTSEDFPGVVSQVMGCGFATKKPESLVLPTGQFYLMYTKDKKISKAPLRLLLGYDSPGECSMEVMIVMMTLAFMQCKNVERIDVTDTMGPSPKWRRRQRMPELRYHVLSIDPNLGLKKHPIGRKTIGDRSGKALHICRGHFARYDDDGESNGLFGRGIYGTFWVPAHVRGSSDQGKVVSTYEVKAPKE